MRAGGSSARTALLPQTLCVAGPLAFEPPAVRASQREKSRFFKSGLRLDIALGMVRTRHQLAPAVPSKKIVNRALAGFVTDHLFISSFEIMNVQHLASAGGLGKACQKCLFLRHCHVLALASPVWLGVERFH